ncbi:MAG: BrnT family toxin [Steroidobacteraceae bacterium]
MSPEFDPKKNAANLAKHGVSFSEADGVLLDPLAVTVDDDSASGEARWVTIGTNSFGLVMVVVWTERGDDVRLISARKADPKERRIYEKAV